MLYQTNVFILHTVYFLVFDIMYKKDKVRFTNSKNSNRGNSRFIMRWWIHQLEGLQRSSVTRPWKVKIEQYSYGKINQLKTNNLGTRNTQTKMCRYNNTNKRYVRPRVNSKDGFDFNEILWSFLDQSRRWGQELRT